MSQKTLPLGYSIRKANLSDCQAIALVHYESWITSYNGIVEKSYLDSMNFEDKLIYRRKIIQESRGINLVAIFNHRIVGFCDADRLRYHSNQMLTPEQKSSRKEKGEIHALYLLEDHQRKGLGSALFQEMRAQLKRRGFIPYLLWTLKRNTSARSFYEAQGGRLVDEVTVNIGNANYQEVAYRFEV